MIHPPAEWYPDIDLAGVRGDLYVSVTSIRDCICKIIQQSGGKSAELTRSFWLPSVHPTETDGRQLFIFSIQRWTPDRHGLMRWGEADLTTKVLWEYPRDLIIR